MPPFLPTLLALDKAATPGPWEHDAGDGCREMFRDSTGELVGQGLGGTLEVDKANAALMVFARNSAARLAAVVEAAGAMLDMLAFEHPDFGYAEIPALRAALLALDEVKA